MYRYLAPLILTFGILSDVVCLGSDLEGPDMMGLVKRASCVVPHTDGADDSPAIMEVFGRCNVDSTIVFSKGVDYNVWTPVKWFGLSGYYSLWHDSSLSPLARVARLMF